MTEPIERVQGVVVHDDGPRADLAHPDATRWHPVDLYLYTALGSPSSRQTSLQKLHRVARLVSHDRHDAYTYPWHTLTRVQLQALQAGLAGRYAPAYVRAIMSAVKGTSRQCRVLGMIDRGTFADLWADLPPVRGSRLPPGRMVPEADQAAMLQATEADPVATRGGRDGALLAVLFGAGLRRAEAVGLALGDLDLTTGTGWVTVRAGKGNKDRRLPLLPGMAEPIARWLAVHGRAEPSAPVLVPVYRNGRPGQRALTVHALRPIIGRLCDVAGVARWSPHDARRTFGSRVLAAGGDLATVSRLLGHSSPTVTARYDHRGDDAMQQAVQLVAPVLGA